MRRVDRPIRSIDRACGVGGVGDWVRTSKNVVRASSHHRVPPPSSSDDRVRSGGPAQSIDRPTRPPNPVWTGPSVTLCGTGQQADAASHSTRRSVSGCRARRRVRARGCCESQNLNGKTGTTGYNTITWTQPTTSDVRVLVLRCMSTSCAPAISMLLLSWHLPIYSHNYPMMYRAHVFIDRRYLGLVFRFSHEQSGVCVPSFVQLPSPCAFPRQS